MPAKSRGPVKPRYLDAASEDVNGSIEHMTQPMYSICLTILTRSTVCINLHVFCRNAELC